VDAPESKTDAVAALAAGPGGGEFTVIRNGEVVFTRAIAGPVLANETMLLAEVRRNLTMYAGSNPGHPLQALYIAEADNRWTRRLRPALAIPIHSYDPLAGAAPELEAEVRGRFAGSAGLLAGRAIGDPPINFAEPRQPKPEANPAKKLMLVAVLAAIVLLGGGGILGFLALHSADEEVALATRRRDDAKQQWATLEVEGKRLAAVEGWKARRVVWLDELYDMADRFPVAGGFHATSFTGKALPPDPKTGKQDNQAAVEVKVTAKNPGPVNEFVDKIVADSIDPAPKNPKDPKGPPRFYVGADKTIGGPTQGDASSRDFTVFARVNNRGPEKFTRTAAFTPPSRKGYPPTPAGKEATKEKGKEATDSRGTNAAPEPRAKETVAGE
jgi:hypothetical protein